MLCKILNVNAMCSLQLMLVSVDFEVHQLVIRNSVFVSYQRIDENTICGEGADESFRFSYEGSILQYSIK
jgi:hypothetical protein